jgi:DNA polymerase-3 subunit delta
LEGEEEYFIDKVVDYAEHNLLPASEASFNLTVFYGRDAAWPDVVNACRRYPMFAERQVVIIKEAQHMKDIDKLESYLENPLSSTVLVIGYKDKKLDSRRKFAKLIKEKGEFLSIKKMYERELKEWTDEFIRSKGLSISPRALALLTDHIGNDLQRIENELEKLLLNLGERNTITEDDIEKYVGVSKEYNVFELQNALAVKDLAKALRIIQYFDANPKAGPIQLLIPSLYGFFSKVFMVFGLSSNDERTVTATLGVPPFAVKNYLAAAKNYGYQGAEKVLLLLHQYNLKSIGMGAVATDDSSLMKELVMKMLR